MNDLLVGCSAFGILHTDKDPLLSLEDQFMLLKILKKEKNLISIILK